MDEGSPSSAPATLPSASTAMTQVDPYNRSGALSPPVASTGYPVIIFGFASSLRSSVVAHFRLIGPSTVSDASDASGSNWVTLVYSEAWHAARAVRRSGEVVSGSMIGVKWAHGPPAELQESSTQLSTTNANASSSSTTDDAQRRSAGSKEVARSSGIGTPVPILSHSAADAYKAKLGNQGPSTPRSIFSFMGQTGAPGSGQQPAASAAASNPFNSLQQQQQNSGGFFGKVSDAIFGI